jgi:ketosteroid isomerase-like protein
MSRQLTVGFVAAVIAAGCTAPAPIVDLAQAEADLRAADAAYVASLRNQDFDAWTAFYTDTALVYPPNMAAISTPAGRQEMWTEMQAMTDLSLEATTTVVEVGAGGDVGYTAGMASLSFVDPDGNAVSDTGPDVHVWRKQVDGSWKIVVDIWNSDQPMPMPEGAGS